MIKITEENRIYHSAHFFVCPNCGNKIILKGDKECDKCHQRIKWEVGNEIGNNIDDK
jgi:predicted RNA-binding Zn-ribbon protein involved in translation (DUF1610 family)